MDERSESDEWIDELVATWTAMYKKSMTTVLVLKLIAAAGQSSVEEIREMLDSATGWSFTERGLYRTMRRLTSLGLLSTASGWPARLLGHEGRECSRCVIQRLGWSGP